METHESNWVVISLGGSIIYPKERNIEYVKKFAELIKSKTSENKFAVITGGGYLARKMQEDLREKNPEVSTEALDIVGIDATRENAEFVRNIFGDIAELEIFLDPTDVSLTGKSVLIGGGWKPGHSSDGSAVGLAKTLGSKCVINLSNIDYAYTADPRRNPDAIKIEKSNWADFRKILPKEWAPGISVPFDPVAAEMAEELGLEVVIMNGNNLGNLENYLDGKEFIGTVVK